MCGEETLTHYVVHLPAGVGETEYETNTIKLGRLYVHVICHSVFQQKDMNQEGE